MPDGEQQKETFTSQDASTASLMWVSSLIVRLSKKGLLDGDEVNEIAAFAASMCEANGSPQAAALIRNIQPSSIGVDPVGAALDRGFAVSRKQD